MPGDLVIPLPEVSLNRDSQLITRRRLIIPMDHRRFAIILLLGALAARVASAETTGADHGWPQFRGPGGTGVAANEARPPITPENSNRVWKVPVPPGLSSPVVAGGRVFLTGVEKDRLVTLALDRETGAVLWRREAPEVPLEEVHEVSSPAAPTPATDGQRLYVYFGSFGLLCYAFDGAEVWSKPLPAPKSLYGTSTSPVVWKDSLFLVIDDDRNLDGSSLSRSRVLALRSSTGEVLWETARPMVRSGWSTPTLWEHEGRSELIILGSGRVAGYDVSTGQERWHATGFSRETIAQPVVGQGLVFVSSSQLGGGADETIDPQPLWDSVMTFDANGDQRLQRNEMTGAFTFPLRPELAPGHPGYGIPLPSAPDARHKRLDGMFASIDKDKDGHWSRDEFAEAVVNRPGKPQLIAIRPGGTGDISENHVAWELHRHIPEIPTPLHYDGRLYLARNGGLLTAVDATDGTQLYTERLDAPGQYSASPIAANRHLYLLSNRGTLSVIQAGDTFRRVHQLDLGEPAFVTPAVDRDTLYIRTSGHLLAFRQKPQP
jgi:outer membrane protein assembly factor BamB